LAFGGYRRSPFTAYGSSFNGERSGFGGERPDLRSAVGAQLSTAKVWLFALKAGVSAYRRGTVNGER
jgi:hypothetical protein